MKNVFFNDKVLEAEGKIISKLGIPSMLLMENAGKNSFEFIKSGYQEEIKHETVIITGKGNNAGDGFVIARHLISNKFPVKVLMLYKEKELKGDALMNFNVLRKIKDENLKIIFCNSAEKLNSEISYENKLLIDAIFGIGFKGIPDKRIKSIIDIINKLKEKIVISVDVPSCLYRYNQSFDAVKSKVTLSMGVKKFNSFFYRGREYSGETFAINIGIPEDEFTAFNNDRIFVTEISDIKKFLIKRKQDSNKYSNGKVFVLSGSPGLTGAAYLSSASALKSGAGAVITGIPASLNEIMEVKLTEVMTLPLEETYEHTLSIKAYPAIKKKLDWADSVLIGPGLSKNEETAELVRKIVSENESRFVIDADGISAFQGYTGLLKNKKVILTPHSGEFSNLIGISAEELKNNFYNIAKDFSKKHNVILMLKNAPSVISDGDTFYINPTGRENLATAGTGDVLSGILSGLTARTEAMISGALAGAYIHGLCGDIMYKKTGQDSTVAGDLIDVLPEAKQMILNDEN